MRRRPAKKAAEEEKPKRAPRRRAAAAKTEEKAERTPRRRAAAAKTEEKAERTTAEQRTTRRRSASTGSSRARPAATRAAEAEAPAEEQPAEEQPAEEQPAEEQPAEEQPAATTRTRRTTRRRPTQAAATATPAAAATDELPTDVEGLGRAIVEVRRAIDDLGSRIERSTARAKVGVFVDVPNVLYGAEHLDRAINMGKLLEYLAGGREVVRATAYSPVSDDPSEPVERQRFVAPFVPHGYRIVTKPLKRFADGSIKGNFDVEMAIDMVTMAERLDVVSVVSGDSDFARLVEVIQGRGVRVEVVAFAGSTSVEMRSLADRYIELGSIYDVISD